MKFERVDASVFDRAPLIKSTRQPTGPLEVVYGKQGAVSHRELDTASDGSLGAQEQFFSDLGRLPLLTTDQERLLFEARGNGFPIDVVRQSALFQYPDGSREAESFQVAFENSRNINDFLFLCNMRLVVSIARRYVRPGIELMDLIQEGLIGLKESIEKHDPNKKNETGEPFKLITYAGIYIHQNIQRSIVNTSRAIRIPMYMNDMVIQARKMAHVFETENGRAITDEELLAKIGEFHIRRSTAAEILRRVRGLGGVVSLDSLLAPGEFRRVTLAEKIPDRSDTVEDQTIRKIEAEEAMQAVRESLNERELLVLDLRFGFGGEGNKTLSEVARILGLSWGGAHNIERAALNKLRRKMGVELKGSEINEDQIKMMMQGLSDAEIARRLGVKYTTIKDRKRRLFARLGVSNYFDAIALMKEAGVLPEGEFPQIREDKVPLTAREQEIVDFFAKEGSSNTKLKDIAQQLSMSAKTLRNYLPIIYRKTGLKNRKQLELYLRG